MLAKCVLPRKVLVIAGQGVGIGSIHDSAVFTELYIPLGLGVGHDPD